MLGELLLELRDAGNTVIVVEHDRDIIAMADHVVDMGPGAGASGGEVVFEGTVAGLSRSRTLTGRMLRRITGLKPELREPKGWLPIEGASLHNLKKVSVRVPLGVLTAVTGVAGSGKSTLMTYAEGIAIDQSAIGGSIRSTPATYLGVMDRIRRLFAETNGVDASLFSFNAVGPAPAPRAEGGARSRWIWRSWTR
ncbi:hypothetical protein GCM10020219_045900 [Nonomuraea dietziae]